LKKKKKLSFKMTILIYSVFIIVIMIVVNVTSLNSLQKGYDSVNSNMQELSEIGAASLKTNDIYYQLVNYASSGNKEYLTEYNDVYEEIENLIRKLQRGSAQGSYYRYTDVLNMLETFREKSDKAISTYDSLVEKIYIQEELRELDRLRGYIGEEFSQIVSIRLVQVESSYLNLGQELESKETQVYLNAIILTVVCLILALIFSYWMSKPIHSLAERLEKVANGDYQVPLVKEKGYGELQTVIDAFNIMIIRIRENFHAISEKVELEKQLRNQQVAYLQMENLLKVSQLENLQAQINPHFMFNTLNSVGALAEIEQAQETKKMITSFTEMLRYNMKKMNSVVTLADEIDIIEKYLYIQKVRFGGRIQSIMEIDRSVLKTRLPCMVLQPFVENAIVHGIEPKAKGGTLQVIVKSSNKNVLITISDNGMGMSKRKVGSLYPKKKVENRTAHSIGIRNVIERLELYYSTNVVEIESEKGRGTKIQITIPKIRLVSNGFGTGAEE
jgi:two-component system, sensor histidine kinase YesM